MVTDSEGKVIRDAATVKAGDKLVITPAKGKITANAELIE